MPHDTSSIDALGNYRLIRPLGKGGMGAVYLAHDSHLNRKVAIKQLLADQSEPGYPTLKKRFLREAQSAANLNHPNIVTIYHIGEHTGQPYIVMEFVDGGSWAEHLRRHGPASWPLALAALRDAAAGLEAAHAAGIIHRDMKPANLMRRNGGTGVSPVSQTPCLTKIVDFGLARTALADSDLTHAGAFIGSPSYVSPEQAACKTVDARSDIYSLGCTLFALLTGRAPFIADDPAEILEHHRRSPLPALADLAPDPVPPAVEAILRRMTAKHPSERFASATAVIQAIDQLPLDTFAVPPLRSALGQHTRTAPPPETPAPVPPHASSRIEPSTPPPRLLAASTTLEELQRQLDDSRSSGNQLAQRDTHISLFHAYSRLDKPSEAAMSARHALALHLKLAQPGWN